MSFGAFVEFAPGREGMVHISELEWRRVDKIEDVLKPGDSVKVKLIKVDDQGRLDFSRKALIEKPEGYVERPRKDRNLKGKSLLKREDSNISLFRLLCRLSILQITTFVTYEVSKNYQSTTKIENPQLYAQLRSNVTNAKI